MNSNGRHFECHRWSCDDEFQIILSPGEGDCDLESLAARWDYLALAPPSVTRLRITWYRTPGRRMFRDGLWDRFCCLVQDKSSSFESVSVVLNNGQNDQDWARLLRHLPSQLSKLKIIVVHSPHTPLTFQQIGVSFPQLSNLYVGDHHSNFGSYRRRRNNLSAEDCESLAGSFRKLRVLKSTTLDYLPVSSMEPLVRAIRENERLEEVVVPENDFDAMMQYGPRLNAAKRQASCLSNGGVGPVTLEEFVEVIIAVRDRVDCLDYFFSQVDPNLYAPAAVEAGLLNTLNQS